jgi:hypothetical protein
MVPEHLHIAVEMRPQQIFGCIVQPNRTQPRFGL